MQSSESTPVNEGQNTMSDLPDSTKEVLITITEILKGMLGGLNLFNEKLQRIEDKLMTEGERYNKGMEIYCERTRKESE